MIPPMSDKFTEKRRFFRHPTDIPVECRVAGHAHFEEHASKDISYGGIAFISDEAYELGDMVELRYPSLSYPEYVRGYIMWTADLSDDSGRYINGLSFLDETDHYHGRIVEQICYIEAYRKEQREKHGRELSSSEAAAEWIADNAAEFPD